MRTHRRRTVAALAALATLAVTAACGASDSGSSGDSGSGADFPQRDLTIIAAGNPGGGLDTHARLLQSGLKAEDISVDVNVQDLGGGGGNPARAALLKRPHDGYTVVAESDRIFLNPLLGTTDMTLDDFTPVAKLTSDFEVWAVRDDSKFKSAKQILDAVKADPSSVSFGVGTVPSDDEFNILLAAKKSGVTDLKALNIVAFKSGGNLNTELLGGHVQVVSTGLSEAVQLAAAGKIRLLSISSEKPQDAAPDVPTWQQLGLDFSLTHWRGIFGPADMPDAAVQWWQEHIRKATTTDAWEQQVEKIDLTTDYKPGDEFLKEIKTQRDAYKDLIEEVGLGGNK